VLAVIVGWVLYAGKAVSASDFYGARPWSM
jgi:hypothetical protein